MYHYFSFFLFIENCCFYLLVGFYKTSTVLLVLLYAEKKTTLWFVLVKLLNCILALFGR